MLKNIELLENRIPEKLSSRQLELLAGVVSQKYEDWRNACSPYLSEIEKVQKYIYLSQKGEHAEGDPYTLPSIYKLNEALKSHMKENIYATNASIFDVKGDDEESQKTANLHKWDLVKVFEKIDFKQAKANPLLKNYNEAGEMIALVGIEKKTTKRKVEVEVPETAIGLNGEEIETTVLKIGLEDVETYSGINIYPIRSEDFFFDTTKADRFNTPVCGKIYRTWLSYGEIVSDEVNNILDKKGYGDDTKNYLKNSIEKSEPDYEALRQDTKLKKTSRDMFKGDQAEILEYRGNITVDNKTLKNYLVVLAGNRVIRCEPDPYFNNTIVYYARDTHPEYKRGISPLRVALKPADISSNITNEIVTGFPYLVLPVTYSPQGSIVNKKQKPPPGGTIEYDADQNKNPPIPIDVSGILKGFDLIQFFSNQTEAAVGMSQAMLGAETEERKTATEIKAVQVGGSIRVSDMIDGVKQGFNIPLVKIVAELKANFEEGEIPIGITQEDGSVKQETITNDVRQGKYNYTYIDSKATMERQAQFKDVLQLVGLISKADPTVVDYKKLFKHGLSEIGYQDVEQFLNRDILEEALGNVLGQIGIERSPEAIEMGKQKIVEYLPMLVERIMQDEQYKEAEGSVYNQGMGASQANIQGGSLPPVR